VRTPVAEAGEHTVEVLRLVGYSEMEIDNMRAKGVI
jgi:crotonobetainyl-CoA:carnitine CoA-transferase CaiB-like acyl-CoA transferase